MTEAQPPFDAPPGLNPGAGSLSEAELLAKVLQPGMRAAKALDLSEALLRRFGGLRPVLQAEPATCPRRCCGDSAACGPFCRPSLQS